MAARRPEQELPGLDYDRRYVERHMADFKPARWLRPHLHDLARVPDGPVMLVGNHGPLGLDTPILVHAILRDTGRIIRPLGDDILFRGPMRVLGRMTASVKASPEAARVLLARGEWVLVYPGGVRETKRGRAQRYSLDWEGRYGFVKVAAEAGVPIVPVACLGNDEAFVQLFEREQVARSPLGKAIAALLGPTFVVPVYLPVPKPVRLDYSFGTPIVLSGGARAVREEAWLREAQQRVKAALEQLMAEGRNRRAHQDSAGQGDSLLVRRTKAR